MSIHLQAQKLSKFFGDFCAVSDISLNFQPGLIHAVLGENGAGKSTLMKLFFGLYQPTEGEILLNGKVVKWTSAMDAIDHGLGMVQQHFSLVDTLSAIDNIMLGAEKCSGWGHLHRHAAIAYLEKLLPSKKMAIPWEQMVAQLTVGQKQRVEILKLLFREAQILFLDEPTAVLTPQEVEDFFTILRALKQAGKTIVLITHKINEVFQLCDTYYVLRQGRLVSHGEVSQTTPEALVESMVGRKILPLSVERSQVAHEKILECKNIYESTMERGHIKDISLSVHAGEILGIAGVDGSGQSHLVDAIMGLRKFHGEIKICGKNIPPHSAHLVRSLGTALVPEDRLLQGLWPTESCYYNMIIGLEDGFTQGIVLNEKQIFTITQKWAEHFDVRTNSLHNSSGSLSGGNQQKLIFAREVAGRQPKLLICHQPTRGVDIGAIELIHKKILELRNQGLAVLLISSELDELMALSDRIIVFYEGQVSSEFLRQTFDRLQIGAAMTGSAYAT